ncbi:hypothetical protein LTR10_019359 [Elasticomyces elasticus]|uniref:Prion-inhibition and propagation HeLo domain-containing protein n=1 Tax=Exophiala sideris TaxID=1016849 RepID=A0ABR0J136_9EURO|nr:hypothetical protein LTR10_019359 [Elasticomyces elasticus]KAK5024360.1 hypothetical protein LTS07_008651 [Exophiala sideris]KAK5030958.1 hypothetical protein LTR13_007971 [Exophiala sideris]KAK5054093.1 hypothetical protein LTR69_009055 [Exophiala sideris]KAK5179551.1 hypothetical protein LTR44_008067 [Eurotiomycetes sp. CCFEE 6388]
MEPCNALGLVATVGSVVFTIGKSVQTFTTFRQKYKNSELNITLLTGHLRTVRAALCQVHNWAEQCQTSEPAHRQFMIDVEDAVNDCGMLIEHLHAHISKVEWDNNELKPGSKISLLLDDRTIKDFLECLNHQHEQQQLLHKKESREILDRVKDDATSLVGFRDSASFAPSIGRTSSARYSTTSRLSKKFDFDDVLLRHKAYQNSFRSMIRRAVSPTEMSNETKRHKSVDGLEPDLKTTAKQSARIDLKLKKDARRLRKEVRILAIGEQHGRSCIVKQMRHRWGYPFSDGEVEQYRKCITALAVRALVAILDYVHEGVGLVTQLSRDHEGLVRKFAATGAPDWRASADIGASVQHLWHNWHVRQAFAAMEQHGQAPYFLKAIDRICRPDYVPTNMDIIRAPEMIDTMQETELTISSHDSDILRVIEINEQHAEKIISQFADIQFCLFAVDLTCYDRYQTNSSKSNVLRDRLWNLKAVCGSTYFTRTIILLILTNASAFEKKIASSPLQTHFKDYTGGSDARAATKYILKRCHQANYRDLPLFWHTFDCSLEEADAEATDEFFRQSAANASVSLVREILLAGI